MDAVEASAALAEMRRRTQQTVDQGGPSRLPAWFTYGTAGSLVLVTASSDVGGRIGVGMTVAGAIAIVALVRALERTTGVRLRMRALRWTPVLIFTAAVVATIIVVGTLLRLFDVPIAGTLAGLAAAVVWVAAMGRTQAASTTVRHPA